MADRARRAEARAQRGQEAVDALAAVEDPIKNDEDSDDDEEMGLFVFLRDEYVVLRWRWIQGCGSIWLM